MSIWMVGAWCGCAWRGNDGEVWKREGTARGWRRRDKGNENETPWFRILIPVLIPILGNHSTYGRI